MDLKELHVSVVPDGRVRVPKVDDAPHVRPEPHRGPRVGLVFPYKDGMRDWQKSHQSSVLEEPLIRTNRYTVQSANKGRVCSSTFVPYKRTSFTR